MKEKILEWCKTLAKTQGFYGRLLKYLENNPNDLEELATHNFDDITDFVLYIES